MPEPTLLASILPYTGLITAALTIVATIFGANSIPAIREWVGKIIASILYPFKGDARNLKLLQDKHEEMSNKLDYIVGQLSPNSGTSLWDAINRLETTSIIHEAKLLQYIDSKQAIMFETSAEGLYTWVSKGYEDLTGRSLNELRNWGWTLSIDADDVALVRSEWYVAVEQQRIFEKIYNIRNIRGQIIKCYCRAVPTVLNGKVIAWVGNIQPIEEHNER